MLVPLLNTDIDRPAGTVTVVPVGDAFDPLEMTTELDRLLVIRYCLVIAGTNNVCVAEIVPPRINRRLRAVCVAFVSDNAIAALELVNVTVALPVIASSMAVPKLVLVVVPHVPA